MDLIVPDIIIDEAVKGILTAFRNDYETIVNVNAQPESDTLLYKILKPVSIGEYDLFEQSKTSILTVENKDPRHILVHLGWDPNDIKYPSIHITLPSEAGGAADGLGVDEYNPTVADGVTTWSKKYSRGWKTQYRLLILTDNKNEMMMLYHLLKLGLTSIIDHFSVIGLRNMLIGGSDLGSMNTQQPPGVFTRGITLNFDYTSSVPALVTQAVVSNINFFLTIKQP